MVGEDAQIGLIQAALQSPRTGCIVEVGVYKGGTAWHLAKVARARGVKLYLYDTFTGIPVSDPAMGDSHRVGDFGDTSFEVVRAAIPDAVICKGTFPGTLVPMGPISFVHCDCDQYQSVKDTIRTLVPLMLDGGIIVFDDYGCLQGAIRAIEEHYVITEVTGQNKAVVRVGTTERKW